MHEQHRQRKVVCEAVSAVGVAADNDGPMQRGSCAYGRWERVRARQKALLALYRIIPRQQVRRVGDVRRGAPVGGVPLTRHAVCDEGCNDGF